MADNGWLGGLLGGFGSLIGAGINSATQSKINKENMAMQKEFAQNGIQWKVQDAQKAGIHPAVALGAQTYQASPSSVASDTGSGVSSAFKHFGSAIDSFIDDKEEERNLQLENMRLQNEKERIEIANAKNKASGNTFKEFSPNPFVPPNTPEGVSNSAPNEKKPDTTPSRNPLSKALKLDPSYSVSSTLDGKGLKITLNSNSIEGGSMQDGIIMHSAYTGKTWYDTEKAVSYLEKNAREAGILPKGYHYRTSWVLGGVELYPEKNISKKEDKKLLKERVKKQEKNHRYGNRGLW